MAFQFLCPHGHLLQGDESQAGQQCQCPYCGSLFIVPPPVSAPAPAPGPGWPGGSAAPGPQFQAGPQYGPGPQFPAGPQMPMGPQFAPGPQFPPGPQPMIGPPGGMAPGMMPGPGYPPGPQYGPGPQPVAEGPYPGGLDVNQAAEAPQIQVYRNPFGESRGADGPPSLTDLPHGVEQLVIHVLCPSGHELETPRDMVGQDAMCPFCQTVFHLRYEDSVEYRQHKAEEEERRVQRAGQTWMLWACGIAVGVVGALIVLAALAMSKSPPPEPEKPPAIPEVAAPEQAE